MTNEKEQIAILALEAIANPIDYLQKQADKIDHKIDILMAIQLSKDANYLQGLAQNALREIAILSK